MEAAVDADGEEVPLFGVPFDLDKPETPKIVEHADLEGFFFVLFES